MAVALSMVEWQLALQRHLIERVNVQREQVPKQVKWRGYIQESLLDALDAAFQGDVETVERLLACASEQTAQELRGLKE